MERVERYEDGFLYGFGVFETVKVEKRVPKELKRHYIRIKNSCLKLRIDFKMDYEEFETLFFDEIKKVELENFVLRVSIIKSGDSSKYFFTIRENKNSEKTYETGYKVTISNLVRDENSELVYHKSLNYLENLLSLERAKADGYDEVLFFNTKGFLAEGSKTNIFLIRDGNIYTPKIESGLLAGVMRAKVIEELDKIGIEVEEIEITKDFFWSSDEIFLTNAIIGVIKVTEIDRKKYKSDMIKKIKERIKL